MCGILVAIGRSFEKERFVRALDLQQHRGPDDSGYFCEAAVQLGHRRLSIIDVHAHSRQPMVAGDGHLVGVFNGEIYNYRELRAELEAAGYHFHTSSDTEVLINGFHHYGKEVLGRLIGMFAFVIFDRRNGHLFAARDRLGIKPLYYATSDKGLIFSSEIKSILHLDERERPLNETAVSSYLSYRYPILNDTFYEGIQQLPPGHYMEIHSGRASSPLCYWSLTKIFRGTPPDLGEEYYLTRLQELFASSVSYRMIADVPVGGYLSGGVDSSAVVAEMAARSNSPVKTFTIGFQEDAYNEFEYARIVADLYETDHHQILLSREKYVETMEELIRLKDAPLGVPNEVPLYRMSQALKKHITVVLSGEGADEIFGGYGRIFRSADDYAKIKACRSNPDGCPPKLLEKIQRKYGDAGFASEVDHFLYLYRYTSVADKRKILHPRFSRDDHEQRLTRRFAELFDAFSEATYRERMMLAFETLHLPGLLQRVDVTTMAASVEARVPFVDHRLVEFAFTIPDKYKLKWKKDPKCCDLLLGDEISETYDIPKYILKKAMSNKLPETVLYRRKMGFPVPLERWFDEQFRQHASSTILQGELVRREILDRSFVQAYFRSNALEEDPAAAKTAWMLFSLELFLRNY